MDSKDVNIESYDGSDAFYSGTDEEYEEFLKNADIKIDGGEPVADTQKINLNETINIQGVIDKFRKTAGGIESGAKKIKDTVAEKIDLFKTKKDGVETEKENDETANDETAGADTQKSGISEKVKETIESSAEKIDKIKDGAESIAAMSKRFDAVEEKIEYVQGDISALSQKLSDLSEKINAVEIQQRDMIREDTQSRSDIKRAVDEVGADVSEIKQTLGSVSKLSDSVFDLKNAQLNTKNALSDLETGFKRLKKKCVLGVTVLSILSAIIIVLEVILMLS